MFFTHWQNISSIEASPLLPLQHYVQTYCGEPHAWQEQLLAAVFALRTSFLRSSALFIETRPPERSGSQWVLSMSSFRKGLIVECTCGVLDIY